MSSEPVTIQTDKEFIARFIEVCGTSEPAKIQRLLNISYQAAKNYLNGRMPETKVLRTLANRTSYSLNWLLTGSGKKFVAAERNEDTLPLTGQLRSLVREECVQVINEVLGSPKRAQPKVVVLQSDELLTETANEHAEYDHGAGPFPGESS